MRRYRPEATQYRTKPPVSLFKPRLRTANAADTVAYVAKARTDIGIDEGDNLTVRVEVNPNGGRQMVIWKAVEQPDDE